MGCCQSSNAQENHDDDARSVEVAAGGGDGQNDIARAAINNPASRLRRDSSPPNASGNRPNQPIRPTSPVPKSPRNVSQVQPPWTRSHLARQRAIFFETRVAGDLEVWSAIHLACDALLHGQRAEAQGLLDASGISCPSGRLAKGRGRDRVKGGLYDERGKLYEVPEWVLRDPDDLVEDEEKEPGEDEEDGGEEVLEQRREAKGKGRAVNAGEAYRVRVRFSTGDADIEVRILEKQTVATLHRLIRERVGAEKRVKFVYLGKVLENGKTLEAQGWKAGDVVSALVTDTSDL